MGRAKASTRQFRARRAAFFHDDALAEGRSVLLELLRERR